MPRAVSAIRIGLVGLGKIARDQHLPAIAGDARFVLVATADPVACGPVASFPDIDAMLAGSALDAVVLCQPPAFRFDAAQAAIAAGKHVFLEKPPGTSVGALAQLDRAARDRGVTLYTAWHSRMAPGVARLKSLLADARIERIDIAWREDVRVWHPGQAWLWEQRGFGVFDPGINALSILTDLIGDTPRMIDAALDIPANRSAPIAARLTMACADGTPIGADFDFREQGAERWEMRIATSIGQFDLAAGGARLSHDGVPVPLPDNREYPALYDRFATLIASGASEVDAAPLAIVADAWMVATRHAVDPFTP